MASNARSDGPSDPTGDMELAAEYARRRRRDFPDHTGTKRATNVSLDAGLVAAAKELGVNISQACERGLAAEISHIRSEAWIKENWEAIQSSNAYVEKHGLPLAHLRQF